MRRRFEVKFWQKSAGHWKAQKFNSGKINTENGGEKLEGTEKGEGGRDPSGQVVAALLWITAESGR